VLVAVGHERRQHRPQRAADVLRQRVEQAFGAQSHRTFDAPAEIIVGLDRQQVVDLTLIEFAQQILDQGQQLGMLRRIAQDEIGQSLAVREPFIGQAGAMRGLLYQTPQGVGTGRQDIELAAAGLHAHEGRLALDLLVEIGARCGDDPDAAASGQYLEASRNARRSLTPMPAEPNNSSN